MALRNPYTIPVSVDLRVRGVPEEWFVALDKGSVLLHPGEVVPLHVLIWTDRTPEWEGQDRKLPKVADIKIEGWADVLWEYWFPIGGVQARCHAVRKVNIDAGMSLKQERGAWAVVVGGGVGPSVSEPIPMAIHVTDPGGALHTETFTTNASGGITYVTKTVFAKSGEHKVQLFVLGGSLAAETDGLVASLVVP